MKISRLPATQAGAVHGFATRRTPPDILGPNTDLLYDADNLNGAVLNKARQAHQHQLWRSLSRSLPPADQTHTLGSTPSNTKHAKKGAAERLYDVHEQSGGVHEQNLLWFLDANGIDHATKAYNPFCGPDLIDSLAKTEVKGAPGRPAPRRRQSVNTVGKNSS